MGRLFRVPRMFGMAFSALGIDSGMIGQFAPVILEYLEQQGVNGALLQSLGGIWSIGG
ncbi:hypothetical protein AB7M32_000432 [Pseudomonas sp. R151218B TE3479]